jgi:hypothetical protein
MNSKRFSRLTDKRSVRDKVDAEHRSRDNTTSTVYAATGWEVN